MNLLDYLNEISSEPVNVNWDFKDNGVWYGNFDVNDKNYLITFEREDKKHNLKFKICSLKFARTDAEDPYAFAADFNKPLVIANTIKKYLKEYLNEEKCDIFIIKALSKEQTRVNKYAILASAITSGKFGNVGLYYIERLELGIYTYFVLYKNSKVFSETREELRAQKIFKG